MKLQILDQIHLSSVSPHTLGAGEEIHISDAMGKELLEKHPKIFRQLDVEQREGERAGDELRQDGPTLQEFLAAGYAATAYPPHGYASKAGAAELEQAIGEQLAAEENEKREADEKARREAEQRAAANAAAAIAAGGGAGASPGDAGGAPDAGGKAETPPANKAEKPPKNKGQAGD